MFLCVLGMSVAEAPSISNAITVGTLGTLPRSVVTLKWEGKQSVVVFANGSDLAPMALLGFSLSADSGKNAGLFLPFWSSQSVNYDFGLAAGDVDGDGHDDLVVASLADPTQNMATGGIRVHVWDETELSRIPTWIAGGPGGGGFSAGGVALADIDADGDLDIVTAVLWEPTAADQKCTPVSPKGFQSDSLTCFNGIPRIFLNDGKGNFTKSAWQAEVPPTEPVGLGARALLIEDFNGDGWLDLLLGAQAPVLYPGLPKTGGFATTPAWVSSVVNPYTYDLAVLRSNQNTYVAASTSCFSPKNCDPANSGYQIFALNKPKPLMTIRAGLWSGNQEIAAAVAAAPLSNAQADDLLGATWTSVNGTVLGGTPLLTFPPNDASISMFIPIRSDNPNALPGTILPMGADILVSQLCSSKKIADPITMEINIIGTQSVFSMTQRAQSITSVELVAADGKRELIKVLMNDDKCKEKIHYSVGEDQSWIAIGPSLSDTVWKNVLITYTPLTNPDILVANSNPMANSALWCL